MDNTAAGLKEEGESHDDDSVFEPVENAATNNTTNQIKIAPAPPPPTQAPLVVPVPATGSTPNQVAPRLLLPQSSDELAPSVTPLHVIGHLNQSPRFPQLYHYPTPLPVLTNGASSIILQPSMLASPTGLIRPQSLRLKEARQKQELNVYCNSTKGTKFTAILDKSRFGSGSRGNSIIHNGERMTPRQFEIACGLEKSRDWRRTIHYEGDTLKTLIQCGILRPHAQSCVCPICSPDDSMGLVAPKYEDEVRSRGEHRRSAKRPGETPKNPADRSKKQKTDIFFPQAATAATTAPVDSTRLLAMIDRVEDRRSLEDMLGRFSATQRARSERLTQVLTQIEESQARLKELHHIVAAELESDEHQRDLNSILVSVTSIFDRQRRSEPLRPNIIHPNHHLHHQHHHGALSQTRVTSSTTSTTEPRSAPPESPVRERLIHDRRRTSSDTSQLIRKVQLCSAAGCQKEAAFMCQGCNKAIYCGRACQETAWNQGHDEVCGETDDENP